MGVGNQVGWGLWSSPAGASGLRTAMLRGEKKGPTLAPGWPCSPGKDGGSYTRQMLSRGRWARCGPVVGVGAGNHWLPDVSVLKGTHPALGLVGLLGRNLTLPVRGSLGTPGQHLPPHQVWIGQCLRCRDTCCQAIVEGEREGQAPRLLPRLPSLSRAVVA